MNQLQHRLYRLICQLTPILFVSGLTAYIYLWRLGTAPLYLGGDEAHFANHAYAIATTGRDLDGAFLPLFFRMEELSRWYQPILFYLIAAVFKFAAFTEA